ncbi:RNase H domain-containing protein [Abeliophyllum distichum]|uniref:RNase H domain-containing protein n=1 Tax=Abeliophyllum distichum TaxID=126358 RepID=A0ABD1TJL0_9LAMI
MVGIDPTMSCHGLKIDPKFPSHQQKRRSLNLEKYEALKEEVEKLLQSNFIQEAHYLNFLLPRIDQLVDDTSGHELLSFIDAYSAIKEQALANFLVEFANTPEVKAPMAPFKPPICRLFVDGSLGDTDSRAGRVLTSLKGHQIYCAIWFGFRASNNVTKYEALIA